MLDANGFGGAHAGPRRNVRGRRDRVGERDPNCIEFYYDLHKLSLSEKRHLSCSLQTVLLPERTLLFPTVDYLKPESALLFLTVDTDRDNVVHEEVRVTHTCRALCCVSLHVQPGTFSYILDTFDIDCLICIIYKKSNNIYILKYN